jgi:hypothetical protein
MEVPEIKPAIIQTTDIIDDSTSTIETPVVVVKNDTEVQPSESIFTEPVDVKTQTSESLFEELSKSNFNPPESFTDATIEVKPSSDVSKEIKDAVIDGSLIVSARDNEKIVVDDLDNNLRLIEEARIAFQRKNTVPHLVFEILGKVSEEQRLSFMKEHEEEINKSFFSAVKNVMAGNNADNVYKFEDFYLDLEAISKIKCEIQSGVDVDHFRRLFFEKIESAIPRLLTKFLDVDQKQTSEVAKHNFWDTMDQFVATYLFKIASDRSVIMKTNLLLIDHISSEFAERKGNHLSTLASYIMQRIFKACLDNSDTEFEKMKIVVFGGKTLHLERFSLDPIVDPSETWLLEMDQISKKEYLIQVDENNNILRFYCSHKNELGTLSTYLTTFKHGQGNMCPLCETADNWGAKMM